MADTSDTPPGLWATRRRMVWIALIANYVILGFIIYKGSDTALFQQIAVSTIGASFMMIGSFLGFSSWHDVVRPRVPPPMDERAPPDDCDKAK